MDKALMKTLAALLIGASLHGQVLTQILTKKPSSGPSLPTLLSHTTTGAGASTFTTDAISITGANMLVAGVSNYQGSVSISDHCANTWTPLNAYGISVNSQVQMYYVANPAICAGETLTVTGTSFFGAAILAAFSNSPLSVVNQNGTTYNGTGGSNFPPGAITTSTNDLVVSAIAAGNASQSTMSSASPLTIIAQIAAAGGSNVGIALAWGVASGTSTNALWTNGSSMTGGVSIANW